MAQDVRVTHDEGRQRWEAWIGEDRAGFITYRRSDGVIDFRHTEVDPAFEGRGVGGALVRSALDAVTVEGGGPERVVASCPFVSAWLDRHPDYQHLTARGTTGDAGAP